MAMTIPARRNNKESSSSSNRTAVVAIFPRHNKRERRRRRSNSKRTVIVIVVWMLLLTVVSTIFQFEREKERKDKEVTQQQKQERRLPKLLLTTIKKQQNGFLLINDGDSQSLATNKLHNELELCFSPLLLLTKGDVSNINRWVKSGGHQNVTCKLEGIGSFQIIECIKHDVCFIESRDGEDYGTPYVMKVDTKKPVKANILHYLSTIERTQHLIAQPHPRYPYLEWNRKTTTTTTTKSHIANTKYVNTKNIKHLKVGVIFEERLQFSSFADYQDKLQNYDDDHNKLQTLDDFMSSSKQLVQCWNDVVAVTEALFDYHDGNKMGHYIYNDIHRDQIKLVPTTTTITREGDNNNNNNNNIDATEYRCHLVDFGDVLSLDKAKSMNPSGSSPQNYNKNRFWYTQLHNKNGITSYIHKYGVEAYSQRGYELSLIQWGQSIFMKILAEVAFGGNGNLFVLYQGKFTILPHYIMDDTENVPYGVTVAAWCHASVRIKKLIHKLKHYCDDRHILLDIEELKDEHNITTAIVGKKKEKQQQQSKDNMKMKMTTLTKYMDALIHMVLEQSTIIEKGVSLLNCTNYEALLP